MSTDRSTLKKESIGYYHHGFSQEWTKPNNLVPHYVLFTAISYQLHQFFAHLEIKFNIHIFAESTRVVIFISLSISKRFKYRIGLQNLVLCGLNDWNVLGCTSNVFQNLFGGLSFTWPWLAYRCILVLDKSFTLHHHKKVRILVDFTWNQNALVSVFLSEKPVCIIRNSKSEIGLKYDVYMSDRWPWSEKLKYIMHSSMKSYDEKICMYKCTLTKKCAERKSRHQIC